MASSMSRENEEMRAYVGLGSNLGDRLATLRRAVTDLDARALEHTRVVGSSSIVESHALVDDGEEPQPDFLNAVVALATSLEPVELLAGLLAIEARHGRVRSGHRSARTLDLDLLAVVSDDPSRSLIVSAPQLVLPHPRAGQRDFVLVPLAELAPELQLDGIAVVDRLAALPASARTIVRRLAEPLQLHA